MRTANSTGFRKLWASTFTGLGAGFLFGLATLVAAVLKGSGMPAGNTIVGVILLLGVLALWLVATTCFGGLFGLGLSAHRQMKRSASSTDPRSLAAVPLQRALSHLALGSIAVWIAGAATALTIAQRAGLGWGIFLIVWPPLTGTLALFSLILFSAWQKLRPVQIAPTSPENWAPSVGIGILEAIQADFVQILSTLTKSLLFTGTSMGIVLGWMGQQLVTGGIARDGLERGTNAWWTIGAWFLLAQVVFLGLHFWCLRSAAIFALKDKFYDLLAAILPINSLRTVPEAPRLLRQAVQPPTNLFGPLRFLWRRFSSPLDPVLEKWDVWSGSSDPRTALRTVLGASSDSQVLLWWVGGLQLALSIAWCVLM